MKAVAIVAVAVALIAAVSDANTLRGQDIQRSLGNRQLFRGMTDMGGMRGIMGKRKASDGVGGVGRMKNMMIMMNMMNMKNMMGGTNTTVIKRGKISGPRLSKGNSTMSSGGTMEAVGVMKAMKGMGHMGPLETTVRG